jgi:hypothetical protein
MSVVVISQPMFFPWIGIFEQLQLADEYVHFDDVQFPIGRSFTSRVQIKTQTGMQWLTVPVLKKGVRLIKDVIIDDTQNWREKHLKTLKHSYGKAPYGNEMLDLVHSIYSLDTNLLAELNRHAIESIASYFNLSAKYSVSSSYDIDAKSSEKLLGILRLLNAKVYITGHGARNYLDHMMFEQSGIRVEYMDYERTPYPQLYGDFEPHVSILDLIANNGRDGVKYIHSKTKYWKDFINE